MKHYYATNHKETFSYFICLVMLYTISAGGTLKGQDQGFKFKDQLDEKQIHLLYNGKLLTAYYYADSVRKPILFPINTLSGITVTRGFPILPRPNEHFDHPHHTGMWLNYEYINGIDFWNNSTAIPVKDRSHYGTIVHDGVLKTDATKTHAALEVTARWINSDNKILLRETTKYRFSVEEKNFIIDRITRLVAFSDDVNFKDVKDGLLGIRVTRELEQPATEPEVFIDNNGNKTTVPVLNNEGVNGEYLSSEGLNGNAVWGTRGRWVTLHGKKEGKEISITIIDHPENVGYPTYWHARGYGLFAANPLGQDVFSKGKEKLNFVLKKDESVVFRYRVVIHEGSDLGVADIEKLEKEFTRTE